MGESHEVRTHFRLLERKWFYSTGIIIAQITWINVAGACQKGYSSNGSPTCHQGSKGSPCFCEILNYVSRIIKISKWIKALKRHHITSKDWLLSFSKQIPFGKQFKITQKYLASVHLHHQQHQAAILTFFEGKSWIFCRFSQKWCICPSSNKGIGLLLQCEAVNVQVKAATECQRLPLRAHLSWKEQWQRNIGENSLKGRSYRVKCSVK